MSSPVIAFTSKYGSTRRYATALGRRLGTPAVDLAELDTASGADPLIVLAPVYATRILGRRRVIRAIRSAPGRVALVVVAMSPADDPGRGDLADRLVTATRRAVTTFHLRGDFDPARLTWPDRALMSALRRELRRTPEAPAAKMLLSGERLEFVDEGTLDPVVAWAVDDTRVEP
ncbi:flavodoxin domain-containing protein [Dietzia sp. UBA5065]|uniref:flavodoxin domain-containing protein n=1 Tax=Dietzia sp. UBA5065 TaxID=1946422 RepID=UPI0025C1B030|nr:flavodoxin domain-containing protein [Dietzia sp. UBA5065]HMT49435.1 flavodoxin domain-containing protein [Dietzia sp.]